MKCCSHVRHPGHPVFFHVCFGVTGRIISQLFCRHLGVEHDRIKAKRILVS